MNSNADERLEHRARCVNRRIDELLQHNYYLTQQLVLQRDAYMRQLARIERVARWALDEVIDAKKEPWQPDQG